MKWILTTANALLTIGILLLAYRMNSDESVRGREQFRDEIAAEFIRGDSNDDGSVDLSDPVFLLNNLFLGGDDPPCPSAGDADDDGKLQINDAIYVLTFLFQSGPPPVEPHPAPGTDPTQDLACRTPNLPPVPPVGTLGGPDRALTAEEHASWQRGRAVFDRPFAVTAGLGPLFNGDSCRGCHLDPIIGGAGGLDVDVVRFAQVQGEDIVGLEGGPATSRMSIHGYDRDEVHPSADVIETRQTPSIFGLGLVDRLPDEVILANADPDDSDKDGISGRARMVGDRVGRFGHKAGVPTMRDFAADAMFNELGITVDGKLSSFAGTSDSDDAGDPELSDGDFEDLVFFMEHVAPAPPEIPVEAILLVRIEQGRRHFTNLGCGSCHIPELEGPDGPVPAYSDFLLHDVADPERYNVNDDFAEPREFRTAPLWGVVHTAPYLHNGSAETLNEAIRGHHGEAQAAREAYEALEAIERAKLVEFLQSL